MYQQGVAGRIIRAIEAYTGLTTQLEDYSQPLDGPTKRVPYIFVAPTKFSD